MTTSSPDARGREVVAASLHVSRETLAKLDVLTRELGRWQAIKNLVGPSTLNQVWIRHVADSLQLLDHAQQPGAWLDLGSGGGFPGLVVAIVRTERREGTTHLVESNGRKCAFLRHMCRLLELDAIVHEGRIEQIVPTFEVVFSIVSARALAPLIELLGWTNELLRKGALGIFPKGQDVENELHEAATSWVFSADVRQSLTDRDARIVLVRMGQP
ncbi:MAG: 16S rRNA (guanine(527)-N(7))-methyltransferase RsmG [Hyphomicrobiales bacterium]|nr:16S rRNA (guanine(527)-N(7))-methyltransferase RsmG [Hyphomicrobiales bacterium]